MKQVLQCARPHSLGEPCRQALNCGSRFCSLDQYGRDGVCTEQHTVGALCFSQNECSTGFCHDGRCAPRPLRDPHEHDNVKQTVRRTEDDLLRGTILRR